MQGLNTKETTLTFNIILLYLNKNVALQLLIVLVVQFVHLYYRFTKSPEGGESMVSTRLVFGCSCWSAAGDKEQAH